MIASTIVATAFSCGRKPAVYATADKPSRDSGGRERIIEHFWTTSRFQEFAETRWSDAFSAGGEGKSWGGVRFGSRLVDSRTRTVDLTAEQAFTPIRRIGGEAGWYYGNWLWKIRGFLDLLVGGVGVRRGRRHPDQLRVGDTVDFWRVEEFVDNKLLRLAAEMKVPGRAWLEFEVTENEDGCSVRQTAIFDPVGLFGIVYWYSLFPLHEFVFRGMLRNICKSASKNANEFSGDPSSQIKAAKP